MEEYNDPIRESIEQAILDEMAGMAKLKVGTDDRKKSVDCASILLKSYHEDCRLGGQLLKDQEEIDLAKKRFVEESNRAERKLELEEEAADKADKWYNHPLVEKAMVCGTSFATLGLCMMVNAGNTPFKGTLEKFIFLIKPKA